MMSLGFFQSLLVSTSPDQLIRRYLKALQRARQRSNAMDQAQQQAQQPQQPQQGEQAGAAASNGVNGTAGDAQGDEHERSLQQGATSTAAQAPTLGQASTAAQVSTAGQASTIEEASTVVQMPAAAQGPATAAEEQQCPICHDPIGGQCVMLPCGHQVGA